MSKHPVPLENLPLFAYILYDFAASVTTRSKPCNGMALSTEYIREASAHADCMDVRE